MKKFFVAAGALTLCLVPQLVLAQAGLVQLHEKTEITEPGSYILTRDIATTASDSFAIKISTSDVDLDLNGFKVYDGHGVTPIILGGSNNVRIHNGKIEGALSGILQGAGTVKHFTLEKLSIKSNGAGAGIAIIDGEDGIIEDVQVEGPGYYSMLAIGKRMNMRRLTVGGALGESISVDCEDCKLEDTTVDSKLSDYGLRVLGHNNVVKRNLVNGAVLKGIYMDCDGCTLEESVVKSAFIGMELVGQDNVVKANSVKDSLTDGIVVSTSNSLYQANVSSGNLGFGVKFTSAASGRALANANVFRENFARGNNGTGCTKAATATTDFCDEGTGNTSHTDNYMPDKM